MCGGGGGGGERERHLPELLFPHEPAKQHSFAFFGDLNFFNF